MKLNISKEWLKKQAELEAQFGDTGPEVSVGNMTLEEVVGVLKIVELVNESKVSCHADPQPSKQPVLPDPNCICNKPLYLYIPPGQHTHCPVHPEKAIYGSGTTFLGNGNTHGLEVRM